MTTRDETDQCGIFVSGYHFGRVSEFLEVEVSEPNQGIGFVARLSFDLKKLWSIQLPHTTKAFKTRSSIDLSYGDVALGTKERSRVLYLSGSIPSSVSLEEFPALKGQDPPNADVGHYVAFLDPATGSNIIWKWLSLHPSKGLDLGLRMLVQPILSRHNAVAISGTTERRLKDGAVDFFMPFYTVLDSTQLDREKNVGETAAAAPAVVTSAVGGVWWRSRMLIRKLRSPRRRLRRSLRRKVTKKPEEDGAEKPPVAKVTEAPTEKERVTEKLAEKEKVTEKPVEKGNEKVTEKPIEKEKEVVPEKPAEPVKLEKPVEEVELVKTQSPIKEVFDNDYESPDGSISDMDEIIPTGEKGGGGFFTFVFIIVVVAAAYIIYTQNTQPKGGAGGPAGFGGIPLRPFHANRSDLELPDDTELGSGASSSNSFNTKSIMSNILSLIPSSDTRGRYAPMSDTVDLHGVASHTAPPRVVSPTSDADTTYHRGEESGAGPAEWERDFDKDWYGMSPAKPSVVRNAGSATGRKPNIFPPVRKSSNDRAVDETSSSATSPTSFSYLSTSHLSGSLSPRPVEGGFGEVGGSGGGGTVSAEWGWEDDDLPELHRDDEGAVESVAVPVATPAVSGFALKPVDAGEVDVGKKSGEGVRKSDEWGWD
ncbi:hypothetical protein BC829DRAFT_381792 [Chytridium lagenaria]|nr:hypothetical protein BC829DRAFT_381792 [Chytridium lagenaria]